MRWTLRRSADDDARRYNRARYRRASSHVDVTFEERSYSISCVIGEFGEIGIPWGGTSLEDARDSFLEYLHDDATYNDTGGRHPNYRSLYVRFNGQGRLLTFQTNWIAGFTVN